MSLAANALTALATLKTELGITDSSLDSVLERLINGASDTIEKYCGRKFARATLTERVKGYGTELIHLERTPVESLTSITVDGTTVSASEYRLQDADKGGVWRRGLWPWTAGTDDSVSPHPRAGFEEDSIVVVYVGGYALAANSRTPGTYVQPYDLEEACLQLAVHRYRSRGRNLGLVGEAVGNASRQYQGSGEELSDQLGIPTPIAGILNGYRRML